MSYKRVLHSSVDYRKSITVSYPASEHGGSKQATVEGTIPIDITVHVDTNAFDSSISRCNGQIVALTDSVVVMNSAQCEAIAESARNISDHITGGFFSMIKSEISQNMAALFGKITSGIGLILEKVRFIQQQRAIMEYIPKRFLKLPAIPYRLFLPSRILLTMHSLKLLIVMFRAYSAIGVPRQ